MTHPGHGAAQPVPFVDLAAQRHRLGGALDAAIVRVLAHCQFVLGPEVTVFEAQLARYCGARHALTTASGTAALQLMLMAREIGPGDAVLCPAFTFCSTAEAVALVGATPVFVDVEAATFNMDPAGVERGIATAKRRGLRVKAVIPVDLFGVPADYGAIADVADAEGLFVLSDASQSFGAASRGHRVGTLAPATALSFYPSKPLGCYGDGGAVITDDDDLAAVIASLRVHGQGAGSRNHEHLRIGINGRLDTLQAAVLLEKLRIFPDEIANRECVAQRYDKALADVAIVPRTPPGMSSVWAHYTLRVTGGRRDRLAEALRAQGIPTAIHYRMPLSRQPAYCRFPVAEGGVPVSERLAGEVLSLPMSAYLEETTQDRIVTTIRRSLGR
jgi:dTDP-4-amino-4,6-dideoxygalactose transaminase